MGFNLAALKASVAFAGMVSQNVAGVMSNAMSGTNVGTVYPPASIVAY